MGKKILENGALFLRGPLFDSLQEPSIFVKRTRIVQNRVLRIKQVATWSAWIVCPGGFTSEFHFR